MTQIALLGASGRLGSAIKNFLSEINFPFITLTRECIHSVTELKKVLHTPTLFLDVSLPAGTQVLCQTLGQIITHNTHKNIVGVIIGTTGHTSTEIEEIHYLKSHVALCMVSNFSQGIMLLQEILKARTESGLKVAELIQALNFDIGLSEIHHALKKDAPSGTALALAKTAHIERSKISALRLGHHAGEHTITISGKLEELVFTHRAYNRNVFAQGAVNLSLKMINDKPQPGLYEMNYFFKV